MRALAPALRSPYEASAPGRAVWDGVWDQVSSGDVGPPSEPGLGRLAVGVTLFRPAPGQVRGFLDRLPPGLAAAIAFDNGAVSAQDAARLTEAGVTLLRADTGNVGIAAALNRIAEAARAAGAADLLLFDQDAAPDPGLALTLSAAMDRRRKSRDNRVAVIGPAPAPAPGHKAPAYPPRPGAPRLGPLAPVQFLATSGSLIDLGAFAAIGPFRADFFIDGVELEWCFRAWHAGYGCYVSDDARLPHRVGGGTIRRFGIAMPRQPPFRMATYLRNAVYAWRLPHVPLRWKVSQAAYLPLQAGLYWWDSGFRVAVLRRLLAAVRDGFSGRLGPPKDLPSAEGPP